MLYNRDEESLQIAFCFSCYMREKARQELAGMRFGLFYHYLDGIGAGETREQTAARWNARVDSFDVSALARQLHELKVPYFFLRSDMP